MRSLPVLALVLVSAAASAPAAAFGRSELKPLGLSTQQIADLEAFLGTLDVANAKGATTPN